MIRGCGLGAKFFQTTLARPNYPDQYYNIPIQQKSSFFFSAMFFIKHFNY